MLDTEHRSEKLEEGVANGVGKVGLFYNLNRWYEPATGRYSAVGPLSRAAALRPYGYAKANPLRYITPGFCPACCR